MCIHITDWNSTSDRAVLKQSFCRICKCSFGALWSLRWRRKYLHLKTGQKHSEQILWDVRTQLTELNLCFDRAVLKHSFCRICLWIYVTLWGIRWKRDFSYKSRQKYSEKVPCDVGNHLTELKLSFDRAVLKHTFCGICKCSFGALWRLQRNRKHLRIKTSQKHSQKLCSDVCIQRPELNRAFDRAVLKHSFCTVCFWIFGALGGIRCKREIFTYKLNRSVLRNCFGMCAFNSQSWAFLLTE